MASAFSHAVAALSIGSCFYRPQIPKHVWAVGAMCSVIPDLDVIGFHFGIHYGDFWGHRSFTHSLLFAVLLASATAVVMSWRRTSGIGRFALFGYLFLATASHGLLDSITNGGLGVAFFSPFNNNRYFLPWRPVLVSPIGVTRFFTPRGFAIIQSEFVWIWLPAILFPAMVFTLRRMSQPDAASS
jgi:inner membrane protein